MENLNNVNRNRMLAQRESFWRAERSAASGVIEILNNDFGYRSAMNVFANFICMNISLWGKESNYTTRNQVAEALQNEKGLALWRDAPATIETILTWIARGRKWDVEGASELFRIFVAVVEEVQKEIATASGLKIIKITSRSYQFANADLSRYSSHYELEDLTEESFNAFATDMALITRRTLNGVRLFVKTRNDGPIDPDGPRSRWNVIDTYDRIIGLSNDDVNSKRRMARMLTNSSGGTNLFSLKPNSLIGNIEWIYGLASGADTSGTTAEIIALCKLFENYLPKDEIDAMTSGVSWYIGPVLAMIKNGHHTMIESAIAITMGERIDNGDAFEWPVKYVPGFYQTLLMPESDLYHGAPLYGAIRDELTHYALQDDYELYLYRPEENAWDDTERYNVSLAGGTIINNYNYVQRTGQAIRQVQLPELLNYITNYIANAPDETTLVTQIRAIYAWIKENTTV